MRGPRTSCRRWSEPGGSDDDAGGEGSNPEKDVSKSIQYFLEPRQE